MADCVIFSHSCMHAPTNVSKGMVFISGTRVKRTPLQRLLRRILGAATIFAIIWAIYSVPYDILREERYRLFGENNTTGLVLLVRTNNAAQTPEERFVIEYKYVDPDGFARIASAPLPHDLWIKFRPGSRIEVIYARARPDLARVPNEIIPPFQAWLRKVLN